MRGAHSTADLLITNQLLYQLSYAGFLGRCETRHLSTRTAKALRYHDLSCPFELRRRSHCLSTPL